MAGVDNVRQFDSKSSPHFRNQPCAHRFVASKDRRRPRIEWFRFRPGGFANLRDSCVRLLRGDGLEFRGGNGELRKRQYRTRSQIRTRDGASCVFMGRPLSCVGDPNWRYRSSAPEEFTILSSVQRESRTHSNGPARDLGLAPRVQHVVDGKLQLHYPR